MVWVGQCGVVWCGVVWCGVVLAEEVLPGCDYRVPGPLTMITRIAKSDNPALSSLCLKLPTRLVFPSWKLSAPTNLIFKWSQMEIWFVWWCLAERREESQWIMYSRLVLGARANYGSQPTSHPNSHSGGRELPRLPSALQISLSLLERRGGGLWGDGDCAGSDEMRWCNDAGSDLTTAQCLHDNFSEIWLPASPYYHWSRMSVDIIEFVSGTADTQHYWYQPSSLSPVFSPRSDRSWWPAPPWWRRQGSGCGRRLSPAPPAGRRWKLSGTSAVSSSWRCCPRLPLQSPSRSPDLATHWASPGGECQPSDAPSRRARPPAQAPAWTPPGPPRCPRGPWCWRWGRAGSRASTWRCPRGPSWLWGLRSPWWRQPVAVAAVQPCK